MAPMEREPAPPPPRAPPSAPRSAALLPVLLVLAGVLLTLTTFAILRHRAQKRRTAELELHANGHALLFERFTEKHVLAVRSLQGLFEASRKVTQQEFRSFAQKLRSHAPAASILAWCPRVTSPRDAWEIDDDGARRPATPRGEHFPVSLVDPADPAASDLGFDLGAIPHVLDAVHRTRDEGGIVSSPVVDLRRGGVEPREGIVLMVRVRDDAGVFTGVVAAFVPIDALVARAFTPVRATALDVAVSGAAADGPDLVERVIHRHAATSETDVRDGASVPFAAHELPVANRTWRLEFRPSSEFAPETAMPWIILALGLVLTATFATYVHGLLTRHAAIRSLAEERAQELFSARESLERAEAERRHAERLLLDAVDRISQGIALFGPDDRILFFNRHFPDSFQLSGSDLLDGATFEEIIRRQVSLGLIEDAVGREQDWLQWRLERHRDPREPIEVRRHTGKVYRIVENRLPNGGTFSVVTDITRERKSEEQLRQSQRMEGIGQLTGGVAHDFNNLLTVIMGNLDLVEDAVADDAEVAELVRDANRAARRGAELTQRLLAFARRQPLLPAIVDVNRLVGRMSTLLERTLGETIHLDTELAEEVWPTMVDAAQLEAALLNLAVNARDAMPAGGRLTIRTANVHRDGASDGPDAPGPYVEIEVADNGTGMRRDVLQRAFEPFFTTKDVGKGSGLGLSMVYGFVRQSGGQVEIQSAPARGTRVRLLLPRGEPTLAPPAVAPTYEDEPRGHGERVVLVEDDDELRDLVERTLASLGYTVVATPNGPEALSSTNGETPPDLLLTDVVLPEGVNGIELARRFRQRYPALPVLFISGYSDAEELRDSRLGRLLKKPFRREQLAREVREVLDGG